MPKIVHCVFGLGCGGAERLLLTTVEGLHKRGYVDQHVLVADLSTPAMRHYVEAISQYATVYEAPYQADLKDCSIHVPPLLRLLPRRILFNIVRHAVVLQKIAPDIVHVWSDNIYAALGACLAKTPQIVLAWQNMALNVWHKLNILPRKALPRTYLWRALYALLLRWRKDITCLNVSRAAADSYAQWLHLDSRFINVLYHGIDAAQWARSDAAEVAALRSSLHIASDHAVVIGLMRFDATKRPELWIEVARRTREQFPNVTFVAFGDGPLREALTPLAAHAGVLLPGVGNARCALSMADIMLHTPKTDGLGVVYLEAQLLGVPLVSTNTGGAPEAVVDGESALLVAESNNLADDLTVATLRILRDEAWRKRAALRGAAFVKERFSLENMLDNTLGFYSLPPFAR